LDILTVVWTVDGSFFLSAACGERKKGKSPPLGSEIKLNELFGKTELDG
jgi:hypothetical protein